MTEARLHELHRGVGLVGLAIIARRSPLELDEQLTPLSGSEIATPDDVPATSDRGQGKASDDQRREQEPAERDQIPAPVPPPPRTSLKLGTIRDGAAGRTVMRLVSGTPSILSSWLSVRTGA